MNTRVLFSLLISSLIVGSTALLIVGGTIPEAAKTDINIVSTPLIAHDPIEILSDTDFAAQAAASSWQGNGTSDDPYIIQQLSIAIGGAGEYCIVIKNTRVYFEIRNCYLSTVSHASIILTNVTNGVADTTHITTYGDYARVEVGIQILSCSDCIISSCTISEIRTAGIAVIDSNNCTIRDNDLSACQYFGIQIQESLDCVFEGNNLWNTGFVISFINGESKEKFHHQFTENKVNGKDLLYLWNDQDRMINGKSLGQAIIVDCRNITIMDGEFYDTPIGVEIVYSNSCEIRNLTVYSTGTFHVPPKFSVSMGILAWYCNNTRIIGCRVSGGWAGLDGASIYLQDSSFTHIENCFMYTGTYGIYAENSNNLTTLKSTIVSHVVGVVLVKSSFAKVYNNTIGWCTLNAYDTGVSNSWDDGIVTGNSWSDYSGTGDYIIETNGTDHFPSVLNDATSPQVIGPSEIEIEFGSGELVTWEVHEEYPYYYHVYVNGSIQFSGVPHSSEISVDASGLYPLGIYNLTLVYSDAAGNIGIHSLTLTLTDTTGPSISLIWYPLFPGPSDSVNVTIYAYDISGIFPDSAALSYSIDDGISWINITTHYSGIWIIPPQPGGTTVLLKAYVQDGRFNWGVSEVESYTVNIITTSTTSTSTATTSATTTSSMSTTTTYTTEPTSTFTSITTVTSTTSTTSTPSSTTSTSTSTGTTTPLQSPIPQEIIIIISGAGIGIIIVILIIRKRT